MPDVAALTEDQAVEELAALLDAAPAPEEALAYFHWEQANAARVAALEDHIADLQRRASAPPPPKAGPEPWAVRVLKGDARLASAVENFDARLAAARATPGDPYLRVRAIAAHSRLVREALRTGYRVPSLASLNLYPR